MPPRHRFTDRRPADLDPNAPRALAGLYHRGQARIWDGPATLERLRAERGPVELPEPTRAALQRVLSVLCWGELAAWEIAAGLASRLPGVEARMGATSQAHDEARHFYVMRDYLDELGGLEARLPDSADRLLTTVSSGGAVQMLLGMHLMIEPVALTVFQLLRARETEPLLCELLGWFERDEARHVALGVHLLPGLLDELSAPALARIWLWQIRAYMLEVAVVQELEPELRVLGITPMEVLRRGQARQVAASEQIVAHLDRGLPVTELFLRFGEARFAYGFSDDGAGAMARLQRAIRALLDPAPHARGAAAIAVLEEAVEQPGK